MSSFGSNDNLLAAKKINNDATSNLMKVLNKNGRLTSLAIPRDLSLGGSGPIGAKGGTAKKVYAPNLKAVRNKNTNIKTSKDTTIVKTKNHSKKKTDNGHSKIGSNLIQTCGLFSEGVGTNSVKSVVSVNSSSRSSKRADRTPLDRPTLAKEKKVDTKLEQNLIKDYLDDSDSDIVENTISSENAPVNLEKNNSKFIGKRNFTDTSNPTLNKSQIFLLQLPDSLPCENDRKNDELVTDEDNFKQSNNKFLKNMQEGQIGKVIKYKSGKMKLLLGRTQFDLIKGLDSAFIQEVMAIDTNIEQRSGTMINLGSVDEKITATPDWEMLFNNCT